MDSVINSLFWAIFGIIIDRLFDAYVVPAYRKLMHDKEIRNKRKLYYSDKTVKYMRDYYRGKLYNCKINHVSKQIPFITNNVWSNINENVINNKDILQCIDTDKCVYPIRNKMIKSRQKRGQRLENNSSLFLHQVIYKNNSFIFEAGEYEYFRRISFTNDFEKETYRWIHTPFRCKTRLRDKYITISDTPNAVSLNTVPLGCDAVVAIKIDGKFNICIHERSDKTVNYPGGIMVVPSFGFGSVNNVQNPLLFSFLREYSEELFDREEMNDVGRYVNPTWFYEQYSEIRDISILIEQNRFKLLVTGCGYDAIGGFFNISLLAIIDDSDISRKIYSNCKGNWETFDNNIRFIPIDSAELGGLLSENKICPSSAFAICRAIQILDNYNSD